MRFTPAAALAAVFTISAMACSENPTEVRPADAAPDLSVSTAGTQVTILPGQSIQAAVNKYPGGTTFVLKAGTFTGQTVVPKSGDVFVGERGAILDGGYRQSPAFDMGRAPYPSSVTVRGLVIQHYAPGFQRGAVQAGQAGGAAAGRTTGWVVADCELRYNTGAGLTLGHRMQVLNNFIHHNDQIGVRGGGDGALFQGNEVAFNNPAWHYKYEGSGREFGGIKFAHTSNLTARGNYVHDNNGNGMWGDSEAYQTLYEANRVAANAGVGIMQEVSYKAVIRGNVLERNGLSRGGMYGGGVLVSASPDVEVVGNTLAGNKMGVTANQQDRGSGHLGPFLVKNLYVHDNTIQTAGQTGLQQSIGNNAIYTSWGNRFEHNTYTGLRSNGIPFFWMNGKRTVAQWQAYGQDRTGKFLP